MNKKLYIALVGLILLVSSCSSKEAKSVLHYDDVKLSFIQKIFASSQTKMIKWYELAEEQEANKKYNDAIVSYSEALVYAEKSENEYYNGLIYARLGNLSKISQNKAEALDYYRKAYKAFEQSGSDSLKNDSYLEMGKLYYDLGEFNLASKIYKSLLIIAKTTKDKSLEVKALEANAQIELSKTNPDYALAISMLERVENKLNTPLNAKDMGLMALAYALQDNKSEAFNWLARAKDKAKTSSEILDLKLKEYQIQYICGDTKKALEALESYTQYNKSLEINAYQNSAMIAQKNFLLQKSKDFEVYMFRMRLIFIFLFIILILSFIALNNILRNKRLKMEAKLAEEHLENEKLMSIAEDLESKIVNLENANNDKKIKSVKMDVLERLCEQYYIYEGTDNLQPKILKEVKTVVNELREDSKSIETMLDENYDGLMSNFRKDASFLKEEDIRLYSFVAAGFSSTTISTLIEKSKSVVYNRISRLKNKIASSDIEDKAKYLKMFEK